MKTIRLLKLVITFLIFINGVCSAVEYVKSPPLSEVLKTGVIPCKEDTVTQAPIITWGGDMAAIYANGNQKNTVSNSIFGGLGLNLKLVREDVFTNQVKSFMDCSSPYLRGTMGMINMAAEVLSTDQSVKPVVIYQLTWSSGGDALVVKDKIKSPQELKNKTIALQAYGPHVDYLTKVLTDAGLSIKDIAIKWVKDLTGSDNTPMSAFYEDGVDAAMVIIPDAMALTSNGTVGSGAEDSVKGARILLSTKTANRIISDVYAVRSDYLKNNRKKVESFVRGLTEGQKALAELFKNKKNEGSKYQQMISASAGILLDSAQAVGDAEGLYGDCEFVGFDGNVKFFSDKNYPRNFEHLTDEIQTAFVSLGLISKKISIDQANWDYNTMQAGTSGTVKSAAAAKFDTEKVAKVVAKKQQQGTLNEGALFSFEVYFQPNQNTFPAEMYEDSFKKVIELASTYGGAIITVEGHSDPLAYLKKKKEGASPIVLTQIKQAAKNLSLTRANSVRDSIIGFAKDKGINIDETQFTNIGYGINQPKGGLCADDPCAPQSKQEWLDNMRVQFKIIQVEAEEVEFKDLQ
ncbi:nitrate/sulfonate/bicarbonate ABC transporter periplasmic protein [Candidatus Magnetoovum chiemensis]|nr:nitrate/sulfonate/bicarbonate ABC transporter periplasmic protein [Candidatus Magnetoovum chiemensis]